ncbi:Receptor-like protein kinase-like protein [Zostera marina]|uniref:non-specific serine/threonine protein kinase n=1 Tax=Zostera marina TaxID=29655 RepID=A0A0K9NKE9_ZOSMR|nr:Receptor-like protein kinase-like protein [Zostera marina]
MVVVGFVLSIYLFSWVAHSITYPDDFVIVDDFRKGLLNPELLEWPADNTDPCGFNWPHIVCDSAGRVTQIQIQNLGIEGSLPTNFNQLSMLTHLGFQKNGFTGALPTFKGLSKLQFAYLNYNQFDMIPHDFFDGLTSLQVLSLDNNPLNKSTGWMLPSSLLNSALLVNLSCSECNLRGLLPDFLGSLPSLSSLRLSYNALVGVIPESFHGLTLKELVLNNQEGNGITGPITLLPPMASSLIIAWLHGNSFTGPIPDNITLCDFLTDLRLNNNKLTGIVPPNMTNMTNLRVLKLQNNNFLGAIPSMPFASNYTYEYNSFCQSKPGLQCSPQVKALLDFLNGVDYPAYLATSWKGNDPCSTNWLGITCLSGKVTVINLPNRNLTGNISPSISQLDSLRTIVLGGNHLYGTIPKSLTALKYLELLNLTRNNISPPIPVFATSVTLLIDQNPPMTSPPSLSPGSDSPSYWDPSMDKSPQSPSSTTKSPQSHGKKNTSLTIVMPSCIAGASLIFFLILFFMHRRKKNKKHLSTVLHPRESYDPNIKITIAETDDGDFQSGSLSNSHMINSGNLVISVQILRNITRNFAPENELGRGGFGVVYKGELHDGTMLAVKRMQSSIVTNAALNEFHSEISVLSKVRHRNLASLLGYSAEGNERILVYEYMSRGALNRHLFHWKKSNLEPLSWTKRLNISLDIARGVEYLHNLASQSFIHRDLKSSNILLGDDFRAKIADFGLVKCAPDGQNSVATRLAGTFGYLAPEYAITGKITTKADVFSFGVVLMELVTGLAALDENRPEESRHLATWFSQIKSDPEKLKASIDPTLNISETSLESISVVAELAGHCTARDPHQRPDMGHAVNVLSPLVEKWKPTSKDDDECTGIDLQQSLLQMVKGWQAADCSLNSMSTSHDDSKGSTPSRPNGFAESFKSTDGR